MLVVRRTHGALSYEAARALTQRGSSMLLLALLPTAANAGCQEPRQAVQVQAKASIEGQVRASVAGVGVGGGAAKSSETYWEAQLPSQEALDNQWYLYYLCVEFESGRIPKDYYCSVSSLLWSRISGILVSPDGCMAGQPSDGGLSESLPRGGANGAPAAPAPTAPAELASIGAGDLLVPLVEPTQMPTERVDTGDAAARPPVVDDAKQSAGPSGVGVAGTVPVAQPTGATMTGGRTFGRWSFATPGAETFDLYGPYDISGTLAYYLDNGVGCVSTLRQDASGWREVILAGAECAAWRSVQVEQSDAVVRVAADGRAYAFDFVEGVSSGAWGRVWSGQVHPTQAIVRKERGIRGALEGMGLVEQTPIVGWRVALTLAERNGESTYPDKQCQGAIQLDSRGTGWISFEETITKGYCTSGAQISLFRLSDTRALFTWKSGSGDLQDSCGVIRLQQ